MTDLRKRLLRIMLGALAIAAVTGAAALLTGGSEIVGRVGATALMVAITAGLLMPMSLLLDRAKSRDAGLLGMWATVIEFLLAMYLIWLPGVLDTDFLSQWRVSETMGAIALVVGPAMVALQAMHREQAYWTGRIGIALAAAVSLVLMVGTWLPQGYYGGDWEWWGTGWTLAGFGTAASLSMLSFKAGDRRYWRWLGVAASAVAAAMAIAQIWHPVTAPAVYFVALSCFAAVVAHASLTLIMRLVDGQIWVRRLTIAAAIAGSASLVWAAAINNLSWNASSSAPDDRSIRLSGAFFIIAACGTLALIILGRLNRGVDMEMVQRELVDISLTCPRCRKSLTLPVGDASCNNCGLRIHTRIEEPRCAKCGYLLYRLTSDACPECGTPISKPAVPTANPAN